jgi:NAD(P)H-hydrate repair Nnr-like enzyme with NAD(P)H-hydrate dehydratase domain
MGDVLSGALGSLIAQGLRHNLDTWQASCLAVEVHALAGDLLAEKGVGPIGMTPSELAKEMRTILNSSHKQSS